MKIILWISFFTLAIVTKVSSLDNLSICLDGKYPILCKYELLTDSQKMLAESLWMANKTKKDADPEFKPKINKLREFFMQALITDHKRQWDEYRKSANIVEDNILE